MDNLPHESPMPLCTRCRTCAACLLGQCRILMQAVAALLGHVQQSVAPRVQSGGELLAQFHETRLLPTGCARSAHLDPCAVWA